jgi:GWxTD domain-containing protein
MGVDFTVMIWHSLRWPASLGLAALLGVAPSLVSQSPPQRRELAAFRDSLADLNDSTRLLGLEKEHILRARQPALYSPRTASDSAQAAMIHLRLGFVSLRLGDLWERANYDSAASEFTWATELAPSWPYGWFGLGLAELGVGDAGNSFVRGMQTMLGKDALTRAANNFARSAEVDSSFVEGLVELSNTALRQRINARMDVALAALRRAARSPVAHQAEILLARGRVEREVGDPDSSLVALNTLLDVQPDNAVALLELARTRFAVGRLDGADPWYRGLALADHDALALYRLDLSYIMTDSLLHRFDEATPEERVTEVRKFWDVRDRDELHRPGERLREHYRRLDYAARNFRLVSPNRQYNIEERFRSSQVEYDDRGVIWIRQGPPSDRRPYNVPGLEPNETWVYHRESGDLILHFVARQDVQDYRLVPSLFDVIGFSASVQLEGRVLSPGGSSGRLISSLLPGSQSAANVDSAILAMNDSRLSGMTDAILRSREGINPIYGRLLTAGRGGRSALVAAERDLGQKSIAVGTETDAWPLHFNSVLKAKLDVLAVGADAAGPQLQLVFGIPGNAITPIRVAGGSGYPVRLRASVLALDGTVVAIVDTSPTLVVAAPVPAREYLLKRVAVRVPPGVFTVRVSLETEENAGLVSTRDTIRVPSPLGPALGLSDLALGSRSVHLTWPTARGDTAWFNPLGSFHANEPLQLFFEVAGLLPRSPYHVDLEIRRPGGGSLFSRLPLIGRRRTFFRLSFNSTASSSLDQVHQEIRLDQLPPGSYVLEVTVSSETGGKVSRQREVTVIR